MSNDSPVLTAQAVESVMFDPARFPSRGYNEDQVDEFLDDVVNTIRVLTNTVEEQQREIDRLKHWRQHTGPMAQAPAHWEQDARARADAIIAAAQVSAEEIRKLALSNALRIEQQTRERARGMLGQPPVDRHPQPDAVAGILDRLNLLRDELTSELNRLEAVLSPGTGPR